MLGLLLVVALISASAAAAGSVAEFPTTSTSTLTQPGRLIVGPDKRLWYPQGNGPVGWKNCPTAGPPALGSFDPETRQASTIALPARPTSIASAGGAIWAVPDLAPGERASALLRVDPASGRVETTRHLGTWSGIVASPDGTALYGALSDGATGTFVAIDPQNPGSAPRVIARIQGGVGIMAVTSDGALWASVSSPLADRGATVARIDPRPGAGAPQIHSLPGDPVFAQGINAGPDGSAFVSVQESSSEASGYGILVVTPDGRTTARFPSVIPGGVPRGVVLTPAGEVWYGLADRGTAFGRINLTTGQQTAHAGLSYTSGVVSLVLGPDGKTLWYTAAGEDCAAGPLTGFRFGTSNIGRLQPDSTAPDVAEPSSAAENGLAAAALPSGGSAPRASAAKSSALVTLTLRRRGGDRRLATRRLRFKQGRGEIVRLRIPARARKLLRGDRHTLLIHTRTRGRTTRRAIVMPPLDRKRGTAAGER